MSDYFDNDDVVKEYDSVIFKRILQYIKPYKLLLVFTILALIISTVGELLVPVLEQQLIDNAILVKYHTINSEEWYRFANEDAFLKKIPPHIEVLREGNDAFVRASDLYSLPAETVRDIRSGDVSKIIRVVLFLLFALLLVFAATFVQTWSANLIGQRVMKDIRLALFKKTIYQSTGFLSRHPVGRIVTRLTGDVETINEFFTSFLVAMLKDVSTMIGVLITLFFLSPRLALVVVLILPPIVICTGISRVKARDAFRRQRSASSNVTSYLSERLSGLQVVQLFRREKSSSAEFAARNKELLDANLSEIKVFATFRPIVEFFATLTTAAVIAVGSNYVLHLSLSIGVLIAFINLIAMFYAPVMDISEKYTILQSAMAGGERVFKLLDTNEVIPNAGTEKIVRPVCGAIDFKNVHFSYKPGEEILKGLNFTVQDGETAAIVGYTGAGKTTVINVLSRLWDIDSGEILLNGLNIKNVPLQELRKTVLPVLQDVFLFSGSIAENISMGLDMSQQKIEDAAKTVNAHDFIMRLPDGYNTILSEGAVNISGGQRQLLSFARVIAHDPAIVILDEATSSIDTETEQLVQAGIARVLAGRTSIVIAHRLSTIRNADRILVLRSGILVEQGKHDELIAKNGLYAGLYRLQFESQ
jgi:ATP-binding cassette subfamily B protein